MYTVTTIDNIDDYKRPETFTDIVYSGRNARVAYAFAVESWIEEFEGCIEYLPEDSSLLQEFKELASQFASQTDREAEEYYTKLHNFFANNVEEIWAPEFINMPRFNVKVDVSHSPTRARYKSISRLIDNVLDSIQQVNEE